jgi:hypothetical protein
MLPGLPGITRLDDNMIVVSDMSHRFVPRRRDTMDVHGFLVA